MVICPPHIDQPVGPAELVSVVGDVGRQIGVVTVGLDQDPVLVIACLGGLEPGSAVGFVDHATCLEFGESIGDLSVGNQRPLREPDVVMHTDPGQCFLVTLERSGIPPLERVSIVGHLGGPVDQVLTVVAVFWHVVATFPGCERFGE